MIATGGRFRGGSSSARRAQAILSPPAFKLEQQMKGAWSEELFQHKNLLKELIHKDQVANKTSKSTI